MTDFNLIDLPLEVLCQALTYLDPPNICTVRQCCKTLQKATKERIVWYHALRSVISDFDALEAGFPLEAMSATELESAASANYRLFWRVRKEPKEPSEPVLHPKSIRVLRLPHWSKATGKRRGEIHGMLRIPGLRYLLIRAEFELSIWDLGYIGQSNSGFQIPEVASLELSLDAFGFDFNVTTKRRSGSLVVCLMSTSRLVNRVSFSIYEVDVLSHSPSFILRNSLQTSMFSCSSWDLNRRLITYYDQDRKCMVAWNFVEDTVASWRHDETFIDISFTVGTDVVLVHETIQVVGSSIRFLPRVDGEETDPQEDQLVLRCVVPFDGYRVIGYGGDFEAGPEGPHITFLGKKWGSDRTAIFHYSLKSLSNGEDLQNLPQLLPIETRRVTDLPDFFLGHADPSLYLYWLSNRRQLVTWRSSDERNINIYCSKGMSAGPFEGNSAFLHHWEQSTNVDNCLWDVDCFSGRMFASQSDNSRDTLIYDFV